MNSFQQNIVMNDIYLLTLFIIILLLFVRFVVCWKLHFAWWSKYFLIINCQIRREMRKKIVFLFKGIVTFEIRSFLIETRNVIKSNRILNPFSDATSFDGTNRHLFVHTRTFPRQYPHKFVSTAHYQFPSFVSLNIQNKKNLTPHICICNLSE